MTAHPIRLAEIVCVAAMSIAAIATTLTAPVQARSGPTQAVVVCCLPVLA